MQHPRRRMALNLCVKAGYERVLSAGVVLILVGRSTSSLSVPYSRPGNAWRAILA